MASNHDQEIDLLEVLRIISSKIAAFIRYLKNLSLFIIYFFVKHIVIYVIVFVISICISMLYYNLGKKEFYRATMIASSNVVSNPDIINIINNLQRMLREGGRKEVARELGCNDDDMKKIRDLGAVWLVDKNKDGIGDYIDYDYTFDEINARTDTITRRIYTEFAIKLDYTDTSIIKKVKKGILNYLRNNEYIIERDTLRKRQMREFIEKVGKELNQFDTLQKKYNLHILQDPLAGKDIKSQLLMMNEKDIKPLYNEVLSLYSRKQSLEQNYILTTKDVITIKTDFYTSTKSQVGLGRMNLYSIILFSFITTIGIIIFQKRKRFKTILIDAENEILKKQENQKETS
jgi:hypothetical protein